MSERALSSAPSSAGLAATLLFAVWALATLKIRRPVWILAGTLGWVVYLWAISTIAWSTLVQQPHWTFLLETREPEGEFFGVLRLELDSRTSPGGRD